MTGYGTPPETWPHYAEDEIAAATAVLAAGRGNYWSGDEGRAFEREFAARHVVRHALTCANGTLALELALRGLGIGCGDEVIVTPRSFVASASAPLLVGATPVFVDVERETQAIDPAHIAAAVTPRTKAVIVTHLGGMPADMDGLLRAAESAGIAVIEDCAQAHGAAVAGRLVGSFGDVAAFSFCHDKILSTGGEGGMVVTDRDDVAGRIARYRDHGKALERARPGSGGTEFVYLHDSVGSNYRMTEMQSAIGRRQLPKLSHWTAARAERAAVLARALEGVAGVRVPAPRPGATPAWYRFYAFLEPERVRSDHDRSRILAMLKERDVPAGVGACGDIPREAVFAGVPHRIVGDLAVARALDAGSIALPVHPTLTLETVRRWGEAFAAILADATGSGAPAREDARA